MSEMRPESQARINPKALRVGVIITGAFETFVWFAFFGYINKRANPMGDGMEWVAIVPWTLLFFVTTVPALVLASIGRLLRTAAVLTVAAAVLGTIYWMQIAAEFAQYGK